MVLVTLFEVLERYVFSLARSLDDPLKTDVRLGPHVYDPIHLHRPHEFVEPLEVNRVLDLLR